MQDIERTLRQRTAGILDNGYVKSAVLLPLVRESGIDSLLFEVRSPNLRGQPGDICFPGGIIEESDSSPEAAALRETAEELGIAPSALQILGPLDILVTPHNLMLHPYVGRIAADTKLNPSPSEVAETFLAPLDYLLSHKPIVKYYTIKYEREKDFPYELIANGKNYSWRQGRFPVYFYTYQNRTIWGLTALILHHFLDLIR